MSEQTRRAADGVKKKTWLDGRANRREFWLFVAPLLIVGAVLVSMGQAWAQYASGFGIFLLMIRRLHDLGRSGFIAPLINVGVAVVNFGLKLFLPANPAALLGALVSLVVIVGLGAWPGQPQDNDFGPPPGKRRPRVADVFS